MIRVEDDPSVDTVRELVLRPGEEATSPRYDEVGRVWWSQEFEPPAITLMHANSLRLQTGDASPTLSMARSQREWT
ncbi:MAG: hypothetical protein HPY83_06705 [Anaerolineae bacterium]|nr:hypothetical protein [Anaerolineae bacterium]